MLHERSVRAISRRLAGVKPGDVASDAVAVVNPGAKSSKKHVEEAMEVLLDFRDVLKTTMDKFGALDPENVKEFMSVFDDEAQAEREALEKLMGEARAASDKTAGPMDFVKGLFKKKGKPAEDKPEEGPSYNVTDDDMDAFVQGIDIDKGAKVDKEFKAKKDFDSGMKEVKKTMETLDKSPTKEGIEKLLKRIDEIIEHGAVLLGKKPVKKKVSPPAGKDGQKDGDAGKGEAPKKTGDVFQTPNAMVTITNYVDLIGENESNPTKVKKLLKELFQTLRVDVASSRPVKK